jgi:hypothetical protein
LAKLVIYGPNLESAFHDLVFVAMAVAVRGEANGLSGFFLASAEL